jgi:hypothetical protein
MQVVKTYASGKNSKASRQRHLLIGDENSTRVRVLRCDLIAVRDQRRHLLRERNHLPKKKMVEEEKRKKEKEKE